jgi:hypothetical protein
MQLIKENKRDFTPEFKLLTTQIAQAGQISLRSILESTKLVCEFLTGKPENSWLSMRSLSRWHKQIANFYLDSSFLCKMNESKFFSFGIIADESTQEEQKIFVICFMFWNTTINIPDFILLNIEDILYCNANTIANTIAQTFQKYSLIPTQCLIFLTDNTNYMSGKTGGAVTKFNQITGANTF